MTKTKEMWTIEDLVSLTDTVQEGSVNYRGKKFLFQFCELTEAEEPKNIFDKVFDSDEEKLSFYQKIGTERVMKMIAKANEKNPDGVVLNEENWVQLPTTLRYQISNKILGVEQEASENFTSG
mgnify:FL=1